MKRNFAEGGRWFIARKTIALSSLGLVLTAVCYYFSERITIQRMASAEIHTTPFVLVSEIYSLDNGPKYAELFSKRMVARQSDGTSVFVSNLGPLSWGVTSRRVAYMDGRSVTFIDSLGAQTTWPEISKQQLASMKEQMLKPEANCVGAGETFLGYGRVLSQVTSTVRETPLSGPDSGTTRLTYSRAMGLSCQSLEYTAERKLPDHSWKLVTEGRAVSLSLKEPDRRLFEGDSKYLELKPSQMQMRLLKKMGIPEDEKMRKQIESLDEVYSKR